MVFREECLLSKYPGFVVSFNARCKVGNNCRIVCILLTDTTKASPMCTWKKASTMLSLGCSLPLEGVFDWYRVNVT